MRTPPSFILLKTNRFFVYGEPRSHMCFILNKLHRSYGWTHAIYDQTHIASAQAHVLKLCLMICN